MEKQLELQPGEEVYVIVRDEDGAAVEASGYMFLAEACGYVIASTWINDLTGAEETLEYHAQETRAELDTDLTVFPAKDCFVDYESACTALAACEPFTEGEDEP